MPRFDATKAFLTYQHIETEALFTKENLLAYYVETLPPLKSFTIGRELYPNEPGYHMHVLLVFQCGQRFSFDKFRFLGINPFNQRFHSHSKQSLIKTHAYCSKEEDFISDFDESEYTSSSKESHWRQILNANSREEAYAILQTEYPRDAVLQKRQFDYWADGHFTVPEVPYPQGTNPFKIPDLVSKWREDNFPGK